jgi:hypothetical protein
VRALFVSAWQCPPVRFQRWMPGRSSRHPAIQYSVKSEDG